MKYYSVETFHLKYDRMSSQAHFHTEKEAMECYNEIIKRGLERGDGVDVRVMKVTKDNDSWKETCVAQMKDEGRDFWSDEDANR
tara:strand:- start:38491 stop:38742 length:252 start_codon:yes stop_codon:yes gene_type:complete